MDTISTDKSIPQNRFDEPAWFSMALMAILGLGMVLALIQYLYNRSLWIDEAMLANNLLNRGYLELLSPLDERQAAPILFLWIERFFVQLIPHTEYALRFFPFMMYIGSAVLFYRIVRQTLTQKYGQLLAVTLFAVNYRLVYYASEVKQYMGDVFCTLLLFTLTIAVVDKPTRNYLPLMISGIMITFLSNIAPILFVSAGLYLILHANSREKRLQLVPLFATWLIIFSIYYIFFIYNHPLKEYMQLFWRASFAFLPDESAWRIYLFFKVKFVMLFRMMMGMGLIEKYLIFLLFVTGIFAHTSWRETKLAVLFVTPMVVHLVLSYFEQYPLELRLTIYFIPLTILLSTKGLEDIVQRIQKRSIKIALVALFTLSIFTGTRISYAEMFPIEITDLKGLVKHILETEKEDTAIYVVTMSSPTVRFYQQIGTFTTDRKFIVDSQETSYLERDIEIFRHYTSPFWLIYTDLNKPDFNQIKRKLEDTGGTILDIYCVVGSCSLKLTYNYNHNNNEKNKRI